MIRLSLFAAALACAAPLPAAAQDPDTDGVVNRAWRAAAAARAAAETPDYAATVDRALENAVLPAFAVFEEATAALADQAAAHCETGGEPPLDALLAARIAWVGVEQYRMGPIEAQSAALHINFWPDARNFVGRALRTLSRAAPEQQADPAFIAQNSAAAQGFPALETLYVNAPNPCPLSASIAALIAERAVSLNAAWRGPDGWANVMRAAGPDNPVYFTAYEASTALYRAMDLGLKDMIDKRIGLPLNALYVYRPRPRMAEAWRTGQSTALLQASFAAQRVLYEAAFMPTMRASNAAILERRWDRAERGLNYTRPLAEMVVDRRFPVEASQTRLRDLRRALAQMVAARYGVVVGFNSADGD